jgi:hypothetical protein
LMRRKYAASRTRTNKNCNIFKIFTLLPKPTAT